MWSGDGKGRVQKIPQIKIRFLYARNFDWNENRKMSDVAVAKVITQRQSGDMPRNYHENAINPTYFFKPNERIAYVYKIFYVLYAPYTKS